MNKTYLIFCLVFSKILFSQELSEYDLKPYNEKLNFKILDENDILEKNDSIEALIFVFNNPVFKNAELSITNNPQLKEIKLFASSQELLKFISDSQLNQLTHLFFERYKGTVLEIPAFPKIEHLTIQSKELVRLNMIKSSLDKLNILDIDAVKLTEWVTAKSLIELGLINLKAPLLENFPIVSMPKISQFSYYCSFRELPLNLCDYKELLFISFNNYFPVKVDKCFKKKIKKGVYSNLTVYDKIAGEIVSETLSKDRKE
jgi:hypothetical protein